MHPLTKWNERIPIDAYILARNGMSDKAISKKLGISVVLFYQWKGRKEALSYALKRARDGMDSTNKTRRSGVDDFKDHIYGLLPPDIQSYWDQLDFWANHPSAYERTEELLASKPVHIRQHLWVYAYIALNFDANEACRRTGVSHSIYRQWCEHSPNFLKLLSEIDWHKKNFFESALMDLVRDRESSAVLFVNRTANRDRGYQEKIDVKHSGNINVNVGITIQMDAIKKYLPLETRIQIRDAIRLAQRDVPALPAPDDTKDTNVSSLVDTSEKEKEVIDIP